MTTNISLIQDSLRLLGVISEIESPSAEQGSHALGRLNRLMEDIREVGVELGWFEQSSTTATAPIPKWAERGIISKLTQDLYATYPSGNLVNWVLDDNQNGYGTILRKALLAKNKQVDMRHMPAGEGRYRSGVSILTDT
jgi:hypothetical protein